MKRTQPEWRAPSRGVRTGLKLYNSLTRSKEEFVPQSGRRVLWYSCGPTVYDSSHMGHARSYITFDILRRVMQDYFGYEVFYCMNITDIDDKIIKRARQRHLFEKYVERRLPLSEVLSQVQSLLPAFKEKIEKEDDAGKKEMFKRSMTEMQKALEKTEADSNNSSSPTDAQELLEACRDLISNWLDDEHGSSVTDHKVFADLARYFEEDYWTDMTSLNVLPCDVLTRVSDYIPEVIEYTEKIIQNGFAYESNGSVYFKTEKFNDAEGHFYAKLVPEAFGDQKALAEGEGDLSISDDRLQEKLSERDFALWKASKPGEPSWDSPWGKGRPGWHIECSVMASSILGESMDIHTGGVDLKFPHHDNELAQSEAYYGNDCWVRYFLHSGHLKIQGLKMSKSLKNFITIKEALQKHSARQLRLMFLLHSWSNTLDYSDDTMSEACNFEKLINEFMLNVKALLRKTPTCGSAAFTKWTQREHSLNNSFLTSKDSVHNALCDNIDTKTVMKQLRELIGASNVYISDCAPNAPNHLLLKNIATYITRMLRIFGAIDSKEEIGFPASREQDGTNMEEAVMPYLDVLATFRDKVRTIARRDKGSELLELCDDIRDNVLPVLGVRLEDREGEAAVLKLVDPETLLQERKEKLKQEEEKRLKKQRQAEAAAQKAAQQEAQRRIPPSELFINDTQKYSRFDEKGMPTHDAEGKEISKGQSKKLKKLYDAQEKRYNDYTSSQNKA